jgi:hypothetical protein
MAGQQRVLTGHQRLNLAMTNLPERPATGNEYPHPDLVKNNAYVAPKGCERFDWSPNNPDVVLPQQPATAVYENAFGQVVIRQEDNIGDGEMWIVLNRRDLPTLIDRLQEISAEDAQ